MCQVTADSIKSILDLVIAEDGSRYFKIEWQPTWVKESFLLNCGSLVAEFERQHPSFEELSDSNNVVANVHLQSSCSASFTAGLDLAENTLNLPAALNLPCLPSDELAIGNIVENEKEFSGVFADGLDFDLSENVGSALSGIIEDGQPGTSGNFIDNFPGTFCSRGRLDTAEAFGEDQGLKCSACCYIAPSKSLLASHVLQHAGVEALHPCQVCGMKFKRRRLLRHHMDKHNSELRYECDACHKRFKFKNNLRSHSARHRMVPSFKCGLCQKAFHQKYNLLQHQRVHTDLRGFSCEHCPRSYKNKSDLTKHQLVHQGQKLQCAECERLFTSENSLAVHAEHHVRSGVTKNDVKRRRKGLQPRYKSKRLEAATACGTYVCEFCNKAFSQYANMNAHVHKTHLAKTIGCPVCGKMFAYQYELKRHATTHLRDEDGELVQSKHQCNECGKYFPRAQNLKRHKIVVHFRVKAFLCKLCNGSFASRGNLKQHLRSIHDLDGEEAQVLCKEQLGANLEELQANATSLFASYQPSESATEEKLSTMPKRKRSVFLEALRKARQDCQQLKS